MRDPFTVLGVAEDADDAEIRRRYLALVRDFPPDRDPDRFRDYRAAYDALSDERKRLETRLLHTNVAALSRLRAGALNARPDARLEAPPDAPLEALPGAGRATKRTVTSLLTEGIMRAAAD